MVTEICLGRVGGEIWDFLTQHTVSSQRSYNAFLSEGCFIGSIFKDASARVHAPPIVSAPPVQRS